MKLLIGEHYYFKPAMAGAGVIKRHMGKDMILRHMKFEKGFCIDEDKYCYTFEETIGNTKYYFRVGKYGQKNQFLQKKPPRSFK